MGKFR